MIDIRDIQGSVIYSTEINVGSKRKFTLMKEDYITLRFSLEKPINFPLGTNVDDTSVGLFEVVDLQKPTRNNSAGGYDYELRLDSYYWKWKNKIFKFTPETGGQEASWSLTASLDVHLNIFLNNLKALGYQYRGIEFDFSIDASVENKAVSMSYQNMNMIDALTALAEAYECEWWVTDNIIHFGRCEYGTPVDFEIDNNVVEMTRSENQSNFATRLYVFGSTKNIPANYRPVSESVVVNGVVQKRLMLPEGIPYLDAYEDMPQEEAIEEVVILEDVYPRMENSISSVETYSDTVENEDGTTNTETFYRFRDNSFTFSEEYILEGEELRIKFQSGSLNGMDFGVQFNPNSASEKLEDGSWNPEAQLFEIVANEDYGRKLPDGTLNPKVGDKYILYGWDSTKLADLGLVSKAEVELERKGREILAKRKIDPNTYNCKMFSDYMYGLDSEGNQDSVYSKHFEVGDKVNLINSAYFENGRQSRIIGYEYNLDFPYDSPIYTVGETVAYSRLGEIESKLESLTFADQTYVGGEGSGVYIIGTNDITKPTNRNVYSALKSDQRYLRKDKDDRSKGKISSDKGVEVGKYVQGVSGAIIQVDKDTNKTIAEVDNLHIRMKAYFDTLEVVESSSVGGKAILSPAGSVKLIGVEDRDVVTNENGEVVSQTIWDYYRCYFLAEQDGESVTNKFVNDDQVYSKTFNATNNKYFWRLVVNINGETPVEYNGKLCHYIDLSKSDCDANSDAPSVGDVVCHRGNRNDTSRQNFIEFSSVENNAPYITLFQNVGQDTIVGNDGSTTAVNPYSLEDKDIISFGYDSMNGQAYMRVYGDMYVGAKDDSTFVKYTKENGVEIKGKLNVGSKIGEGQTVVEDGIIQSSLVKLGTFVDELTDEEEPQKVFKIFSGTSGEYDESKRGQGIAAWYGGDNIDIFDFYNEGRFEIPEGLRPATGVDRMDGTGYRANGALWWENNGKVHADPLSFFVGEKTVGSLLTAFQIFTKKDGEKEIIDYILPNAPFGSLIVNDTLKIGDKVIKQIKENGVGKDIIYIDANLVVRGSVTMYGDSANYDISSIYDALPIDGQTIYWEAIRDDNGVVIGKVLKAQGGGGTGGGVADSVAWSNVYGKPTWLLDDKINYSEIEGTPNLSVYQLKITSDNKLDYSLISDTPDLSVYALETDIPSLSGYATEQWVKDRGYATTDDLDSRINSLVDGAPAAYDTLKEIADVLSGNVNSIGDIITTLGTKWTQDNTKISNWDSAYGWGNHANAGYAKKSDIEGKYVTIAGDEDITGIHNFTNGFKVGGNRIYESKDGIIYINANVVLKGGLTMYGLDSSDVPSIIESLPIAGTTVNSKGIAYFDGTQFTVSNGKVTIKDGVVGTDISEVENLLAQKGYATEQWVTSQNYLPKSSYTASDILSKIKEIDGSDSGLDSDLLDGYNESSFFRSSRGTISSDDLDTYFARNSGCYSVRLSDYTGSLTVLSNVNNGSVSSIELYAPHYNISYGLKLRFSVDSNRYTSWRDFAFTDSNVASATKLNDDSAFTIWGQTFFENGKPKSVDGAMTVNGNASFNGNVSATEVSVNGITLKKSKDGILYLDGNLVVKGGVTMYGTDSSSAPSILDSLPVASTSAKGIAQFNSTYFSVSNGVVSIKDGSVGLNESELNEILNGKGYLVSSDLGALAFKSNLLAADIPSLDWSKITSGKPTTISGYGITDAITTSNIGNQSVNYATSAGNANTLGSKDSTEFFRILGTNNNLNSFGDDSKLNGVVYINRTMSGTSNAPFDYGTVLAINSYAGSWMLGSSSSGSLMYRNRWWSNNGYGWSSWRTIAFTDSNITGNAATATYAESAGSSTKAYQDGNGDNIVNTYLAKSSYTASDVLSKLKTVDGTNSGIDADLLDGHHGSYYASAASLSNYFPITGGNINGSVRINGSAEVSGGYLMWRRATGANSGYFDNNQFCAHKDYTWTATIFEWDSSGHLDVKHNLKVGGNLTGGYFGLFSSSNNPYLQLTQGSATWYVQAYNGYMYLGIGISKALRVDSAGNLLTSGGVTMYSQRSLKNVLDERGLSLEELSLIKPTRYTWKDGRDNNIHFGGIADDIQQVLPEVVYKTKEGVLTMDYGNAGFAIAASLIKPVVDHEQRIKALEKENELLKQELNRLRA